MNYLYIEKIGSGFSRSTNSLNEAVAYIRSEPITACYFHFSCVRKYLLTDFFITYHNNLMTFLLYDIMDGYQYVVEVDSPCRGFCFHKTLVSTYAHYKPHGSKIICLIDGYETTKKNTFNWKKEGF